MLKATKALIFKFGSFSLDTKLHQLSVSESSEQIALTPRAVSLLFTLVCSKGRVVTKDELLDRVWAGSMVEEGNLSQTMFVLRKTLGDDPKRPKYIRTVPGRGYQFVAEVNEVLKAESYGLERLNRFGVQPAINTNAQKAYIQGHSFWNRRTEDGLKRSIEHFEEALRLDPDFANAYAGIAKSHRLLADYYDAAVPPNTRNENGNDAAMAEYLAEAHTTLAYAQAFYEWDWAAADGSFKKSLGLNPRSAVAHQWYGDFLSVVGRFDEARQHLEHAIKLQPESPVIATGLASYYYARRDARSLISQALKIIDLEPSFGYGHFYLGFGYEFQGMDREAVDAFAAAATAFGEPEEIGEELKAAYEQNGMTGMWHMRLEQYETRPHLEHYPSYLKALVPIRLGDKETSLAWLIEAFEQRDRGIIYAKYDPLLSSMRNDPRFHELLRQIGL